MVSVNSNDGDERVSVLLHNGDEPPTFTPTQYRVRWGPGSGGSELHVALGDLNNDGCLDIVTTNDVALDISVLLNVRQ